MRSRLRLSTGARRLPRARSASERAAPPAQVFGQPLLPATALLEGGGAAAAMLLDARGVAGGAAAARPALLAAAIPAPMRIGAGGVAVLETSVALAPGASPAAVSMRSLQLGSARPALHLAARVAACGAHAPASVARPGPGRAARSAALSGLLPGGAGGARAEPSALGGLAAAGPAHEEGSGFWAHPAASDACLHLGASLGAAAAARRARAAGLGGGGAAAHDAGVRVPTALEAALAPSACAAGSAAWAAVGCIAALRGGAALSSYAVRSALGARSTLTLAGVRAAPMAPRTAAAAAVAAPAGAAAPGMVYALEWRTTAPVTAALPSARAPPHHPLVAAWRLEPASGLPAATLAALRGEGRCWHRAAAAAAAPVHLSYVQAGAALAAAAASLAAAQRLAVAAPGLQGCRVQLWAAGAPPRGPGCPPGPCAAGAQSVGILRVAAQEAPDLAWGAVHVSACAAGAAALGARRALSGAPDGTDAAGAAVARGALLRPQMLRAAAPHGAGAGLACALGAGVLVTGGLGALGLLTAAWLVAGRGDAHVWLVGRAGRLGGGLHGHLAGGGCAVSAARCDVVERGEVCALARLRAAARAPAFSGLVHAGGSLEDSVLPGQTLGALRRVAAPKLAGAGWLGAAAAAAPLGAAALFSSTSALLGPPGQANYAAANAALGTAAEAQQAAGAPLLRALALLVFAPAASPSVGTSVSGCPAAGTAMKSALRCATPACASRSPVETACAACMQRALCAPALHAYARAGPPPCLRARHARAQACPARPSCGAPGRPAWPQPPRRCCAAWSARAWARSRRRAAWPRWRACCRGWGSGRRAGRRPRRPSATRLSGRASGGPARARPSCWRRCSTRRPPRQRPRSRPETGPRRGARWRRLRGRLQAGVPSLRGARHSAGSCWRWCKTCSGPRCPLAMLA